MAQFSEGELEDFERRLSRVFPKDVVDIQIQQAANQIRLERSPEDFVQKEIQAQQQFLDTIYETARRNRDGSFRTGRDKRVKLSPPGEPFNEAAKKLAFRVRQDFVPKEQKRDVRRNDPNFDENKYWETYDAIHGIAR